MSPKEGTKPERNRRNSGRRKLRRKNKNEERGDKMNNRGSRIKGSRRNRTGSNMKKCCRKSRGERDRMNMASRIAKLKIGKCQEAGPMRSAESETSRTAESETSRRQEKTENGELKFPRLRKSSKECMLRMLDCSRVPRRRKRDIESVTRLSRSVWRQRDVESFTRLS